MLRAEAIEIRVRVTAGLTAVVAGALYAIFGLGFLLSLVVVATVVAVWPAGTDLQSRVHSRQGTEMPGRSPPLRATPLKPVDCELSTVDARMRGERDP